MEKTSEESSNNEIVTNIKKKKKTNAERQKDYRQRKKEKEKMCSSTNASNLDYRLRVERKSHVQRQKEYVQRLKTLPSESQGSLFDNLQSEKNSLKCKKYRARSNGKTFEEDDDFSTTTSNIYDTDNNEDSGSDKEEINITQDNILQSSPVTQCPQSPSISKSQKSTNKRKKFKVTELLDKRSKERSTELMTQLISKKNTDEYDDVDHFFKSLALSVKKLTPHLISQAKLKMLTIVTDLELQAADNLTHNIYIIPSSSRV